MRTQGREFKTAVFPQLWAVWDLVDLKWQKSGISLTVYDSDPSDILTPRYKAYEIFIMRCDPDAMPRKGLPN